MSTARLEPGPHLLRTRVVAILRADTGQHLRAVAETLLEEGVTCLELTTGTPGYLDVLRQVRSAAGAGAELGVGTVLTPEHVHSAAEAGASFVVAPVLDPEVGSAAAGAGLAWYPGALSPTEVLSAWRQGATAVKVFPAAAAGGPRFLRDVLAPLAGVRLVPTGGVAVTDVGAYLAAGALAVGVGGPLIGTALRDGDLPALRGRARAVLGAAAVAR